MAVYCPGGLIPEVTGVGTFTDVYSYMSFDGGTSLFGGVIGQNFITGVGGTVPSNGWIYNSTSKTLAVYDNISAVGFITGTDVSVGGNLDVDGDVNSVLNINMKVETNDTIRFRGFRTPPTDLYLNGPELKVLTQPQNTSGIVGGTSTFTSSVEVFFDSTQESTSTDD